MAINSPLLELSIHGAKGVLFSIAGGDDLTMFEIQEAAKVVTESIDPNAKVIFGTVRDEKMKKNEVKVTVIASGFPDNITKKPLFHTADNLTLTDEKKGKIYNSMPTPTAAKEVKPLPEEKKEEKKPITTDDDDSDWGAVPAFLRRSKK